jgi:hypothetical protein
MGKLWAKCGHGPLGCPQGLSVPANVARRSKTDVLIVHTTP